MKKGIWILLFLYVCLPLRAQNSKELIEILLNFCQQVTQEEPSEEKIYAVFQSISPEKRYLLLEEKKSSFAGFTQEKIAYPFRFGKNINRIQDDTQKPSGLLAELRKFKSSSKQNFGKQVKIKVIKNEATNFIQ